MTDADRRALMEAGEGAAFRAGEMLFDCGAAVDKVYFLVSGAVSLTMPLGDRAAVEVMIMGRDSAVGLFAFDGPVTAFGRVRAETDGSAITVPTKRLVEFVKERPGVREVISREVARIMRDLAQAAACNAVHKLEPRLAKCLLRFHDRVAGDELSLTQEHMSRMLGVSRTTLNAVAQSLQAQAVVRYTRGRLGIVDRPKLEGIACECYGGHGLFAQR